MLLLIIIFRSLSNFFQKQIIQKRNRFILFLGIRELLLRTTLLVGAAALVINIVITDIIAANILRFFWRFGRSSRGIQFRLRLRIRHIISLQNFIHYRAVILHMDRILMRSRITILLLLLFFYTLIVASIILIAIITTIIIIVILTVIVVSFTAFLGGAAGLIVIGIFRIVALGITCGVGGHQIF